jgi:hypothetical protein
LIGFSHRVKGPLRGFATVELPCGLRIADVMVFVGPTGAWATLPGKPVLDPDGRHVVIDGKKQWAPLLEWRRGLNSRFSAAVVELVSAEHPGVIEIQPDMLPEDCSDLSSPLPAQAQPRQQRRRRQAKPATTASSDADPNRPFHSDEIPF